MSSNQNEAKPWLARSLEATAHISSMPEELQFHIADQFDLSDYEDLKSLLRLGGTSRQLRNIIHDKVRVAEAIRRCLLHATKILDNMEWTTLAQAVKLHTYQNECRQLISSMDPIIGEYADIIALPLDGWKNILNIGFLLYAKMWDFNDRELPDLQILDAFTPIEIVVLMYCTLLVQHAWTVRPDIAKVMKPFHDHTKDMYLYSLRHDFLNEGPRAMLRLWQTEQAPGKILSDATQRVDCCHSYCMMGPTMVLDYEMEENIYLWTDEYVDGDLAPFTEAGIDEVGALTLRECLEWWTDDSMNFPWSAV